MDRLFYLYFGFALALTVSPNPYIAVMIVVVGIVLAVLKPSCFQIKCGDGRSLSLPSSLQPHSIQCFVGCFSIILAGALLYWMAYYPGGYNLDASWQWAQAHGTASYNDWHPVFSTLLIQLCAAIYDSFAFCIFVQILAFSLSCALVLSTLNKNGVPMWITLAVSTYLALNPAIALNTICMTKDVQFTMLSILLTDMLIRIYFTDGQWLTHFLHWLYIAVVGAGMCLVRHNGILYVISTLLLIIIRYRDTARHIIRAALICAALVIAVKVPIWHMLDVSPHDNPAGEMIGVPMAIMVNALVQEPDRLPEEVHTFLNTIADDRTWSENYYAGEWDSCKWILPGVEKLKNVPLSQILKYTLSTIAACPDASYDSFRENTSIVWQPFHTPEYWVPEVYIEWDEFEMEQRPVWISRA